MAKSSVLLIAVATILTATLAACTLSDSAPTTHSAADAPANTLIAEAPVDAPTVTPAASDAATEVITNIAEAVEPATADTSSALSFTPATYRDETAGIGVDYPADWTLDPSSQAGVRGAQALLVSPGSSAQAIADGGTRVSVMTYLWDPKNDLDAWVTQRRTAWDASGFTLLREDEWTLSDGRAAQVFVVQAPDSESITLLTTVGEDYLQVTGEGDLALAEEILRTVRPLD